jgi:1,4-alpha-glucan branching enzyme
MSSVTNWLAPLSHDLQRIADGRHHDPHAVLGAHEYGGRATVLAFLPSAVQVRLDRRFDMRRFKGTDFFYWRHERTQLPPRYRLSWIDQTGALHEQFDPYSFPPTIRDEDLAAFAAGWHASAWHFLGAQPLRVDDIDGVRFAVWALHAEGVSAVGSFCDWDGRRYPMRRIGASGVWEVFIPDIGVGEIYKFELRGADGVVSLKSDPYARAAEQRPANASLVTRSLYHWGDAQWLARRHELDWQHAPMSIYEVHAGSWRRRADGQFLTYREFARELVPYVKRLGFTHVELMPLTEHPLDDSWGYQTTGYFAPTSRYGSPDDLRYFVDYCHRHGVGVLLDWVPAHFPRDAHGLARFDGTPLYEYRDPRMAEQQEWGTLVFDYGRPEVRSFLISSACYWLEEFHFDGLRVDAVASMLYLDFGRSEFVPNRYGGRHNLEAIALLRALNSSARGRNPGSLMIAEESSDWSMVTGSAQGGGLGFNMKWNMGWMHDTLEYMSEDPLHRQHHHNKLTFSMTYAYNENFVLPLSHDEVVHLKRSLLGRMPGDAWRQFANLRLLYSYMWTFPGKKLLFMGGEFAQPGEWEFGSALPWPLSEQPAHAGVQRVVADLNCLYVSEPALHRFDFEPRGFRWLDCNDQAYSVLSYARFGEERLVVVVLNFTPVPRHHYRIGVPRGGPYRELFNSDSSYYGGSNVGNGALSAQPLAYGEQPFSLELTLPPLGALILAPQ